MWLHELGANVTGVALGTETVPNHWSLLDLPISDRYCDIRDGDSLKEILAAVEPDIVFHLAAQSLVRRSYRSPYETWSTNVLGTVNVLEAVRCRDSVRAVVAVTSDKCYENREWVWGYRETDRLGGHDPYSASKAGCEFVVASYRRSFFNYEGAPLLATTRSGNVLGGGDWSEDRLIPDLVRATEKRNFLDIRSPTASRPWQHVLDSLSGYLSLGQQLLAGDAAFAGAWNFGPELEDNRSVEEVLRGISRHWTDVRWRITDRAYPHEARLLYLDSAKARGALGWRSVWNFDATIFKTVDWYRAWLSDRRLVSRQQLNDYVNDAAMIGVNWAQA
jgi:CDP-glucose 4,6-dehydratase